ncbi:MAG: hypothetical protein COA88_02905 [Kordia sp.]|nr:MAG: hypothetical protein COA88_02905 [Kordia sp.]
MTIKLIQNYFVVLLLATTTLGLSQGLSSKSFKSSEHLSYQASYNMSGVLTTFAEVNMKVATVKTSKNSYLHLKCTANTYKKWDSFFKIRDLYEAYVSPYSLKPSLYKRDNNENGTIRKEKYIYKGNSIQSTYVRGRSGVIKANFTIPSNTRDIVSTIYYIRNLPIEKASTGDQKDFNIVFDRKSKTATLTFMGTETISTVLGYKKCYKIGISVKKEKLLKGKANNIIYITADRNKVPVLIKFSIPVGSGQLKLIKASNLKY